MAGRNIIVCIFLTLTHFSQIQGESERPFRPENVSWDSFTHFPPLNVVYHPVSTKNREAQQAFDRGLLAIYAFNHDQAYISFQKASEIDPELAMAYWGMALALGENINTPITPEKEKRAYALIQKAVSLIQNPRIISNENERAYINALVERYSSDPNSSKKPLSEAYAKAMKQVVAIYPDDLDAAVLFAESLMDLRPWKLWTLEGEPVKGTLEVVEILENILKRNPDHLGANHYYIHALEASRHPERALISAYRLTNLLPEWGHILHMPSHIFILAGDYEKAVEANQKAIEADQKYIKDYGMEGDYPLHYTSHNYFFLCRAYLWQEQYEEAIKTANELQQFLLPHIERMPDLEYYLLAPLQVNLYFHHWNEILRLPEPIPGSSDRQFVGASAFWHFARAMAYVSLGDVENGKKEQAKFLEKKGSLPKEERLGYNSASQVLDIASALLEASFAKAREDSYSYIHHLRNAVAKQDLLNYNEPPDWYYPIRQSLGAALIEAQYVEEAERVFRKALERLPRNGRSLFGLLQSLKLQDQFNYWIERETKEALKYAKYSLTLKDL